ncbi:hypothetical protein [Natronomonas sp.]|uniref:hypothetical protein n=1 Tax=Natronomonas sp. TaxID=2184060 RepID=UPI003989CB20
MLISRFYSLDSHSPSVGVYQSTVGRSPERRSAPTFTNHEDVSSFSEYCEERAIPYDVNRVYRPSEAK